jgi:hypothetical protein
MTGADDGADVGAAMTTQTEANVPSQASASPSSGAAADHRRANTLLVVAVLALTVLRFAVAANTGLVDDEAYYRIWSLAPALSYYDHPPMVAWVIGAGRELAGDTTFGVRLLAPLSVLVGAAILWRTAALLSTPDIARRATWVLLAMPLLAVGGIIVTPDLPSVLFAGAVLWGLAELDRSQNANWWLAIGLFAGLGFLSKYTNLFLGATILVWLIAGRGNGRWWRAPQLWIGGLIAALVASPVFIWNAEHGWVSFSKQFGRVAENGPSGPIYEIEFVGVFLALASPVIGVLAIAGLVHATRSAIRERRSADVLLVAAVLPMLAYFIVHALHDRVQGNWPAPLYPPLAICAVLGLDALVPEGRRRAVFAAALGVGFVMTAFLYAHAVRSLVAVAKDQTEQMRGWPELGNAIEEKRRESGAAWVTTSSYATTGQMAFALRGKSEVAQLDQRIRYIFLPPLPADLVQKPALYVELQRRVDLPRLHAKFRKVEPLGTLKRDNGTATGATYVLFLVSDPPAPPL